MNASNVHLWIGGYLILVVVLGTLYGVIKNGKGFFKNFF